MTTGSEETIAPPLTTCDIFDPVETEAGDIPTTSDPTALVQASESLGGIIDSPTVVCTRANS